MLLHEAPPMLRRVAHSLLHRRSSNPTQDARESFVAQLFALVDIVCTLGFHPQRWVGVMGHVEVDALVELLLEEGDVLIREHVVSSPLARLLARTVASLDAAIRDTKEIPEDWA